MISLVNIILIQSSLNPDSRTAVVIKYAAKYLKEKSIDYDIIDLREFDIPFCDARPLSQYGAEVLELYDLIKVSDAFIIGYPVYMYTISGVLKNFLDIIGGAMVDKYFGIIANAGGKNGYMSSSDLINLMLYDINSTAVMPQVYSYKSHFSKNGEGEFVLSGQKPKEKTRQMIDALLTKLINKQEILSRT